MVQYQVRQIGLVRTDQVTIQDILDDMVKRGWTYTDHIVKPNGMVLLIFERGFRPA